nr:hypothetical protein [Tanacetum cinerariifolium]
GFTIGATPPKIARKFKKASPFKKDINLNLVHVEEEPNSTKKKVSTKKTTRKQSTGVVLRDTHVETSSKRKEKVDVTRGKGMELLSEVALTEDAQFQEVRRKSMRDFHKTHPSGSVLQRSNLLSRMKELNDSDDDNTQSDNEKGSDSGQEIDKNESGFEFDQQENEEEVKDDDEEEDKFIKTPSNYTPTDDEDDTNFESRLMIILKEGADAEMINVQQGNENLEITLDQVIEDAHIHHEEPSSQITTLHTVPVTVISESSLVYTTTIHQSSPTLTHPLPLSTPTPPPTTKATNPLSTLSDFASVFQFNNKSKLWREQFLNSKRMILLKLKMVTESLEHAILAKESSQPQSSYDAAASLTEFELKKILIDKMDKSESYLAAHEHREFYDGLIKLYELDKTLFSTYDKV